MCVLLAESQPVTNARACSANNGGTPVAETQNPIDIFTGSKAFSLVDFETADGSLRLRRVFAGLPYGGAPYHDPAGTGTVQVPAAPLGLANWFFDFQYELQIGGAWTGSKPVLVVFAPFGGSYAFQRQTSGEMVPYVNPTIYPLPQTDYTLSFVGTWPSDLSTITSASTMWKLTDPDDNVWTLQTFQDPVSGLYNIARPVSMRARSGFQLTFQYDSNAPHQLVNMTDSFGKSITFEWLINNPTDTGTPLPRRLPKPSSK